MRLETVDIGKTDSSKRAVVQAYVGRRVVVCRDNADDPLIMGVIDPNFPMADSDWFQLEYREKGSMIKRHLQINYPYLRSLAIVRRF